VHHGYTNLKGTDFVWAPLTAAEYAALTPRQRLMQRIYRSGWAPGLYYLVEIWWRRMYFPSRTYMGARRQAFLLDGLLVTAFGLLWAGALAALAATGQSTWRWCWLMGLVRALHVLVRHDRLRGLCAPHACEGRLA
jgi:omega-6 fatty acid desaturase (delta-12 desaturase)